MLWLKCYEKYSYNYITSTTVAQVHVVLCILVQILTDAIAEVNIGILWLKPHRVYNNYISFI